MATCKECLHHGVCKDRDNLMLTVNNIFELMYQHGVEHSCVHFKSIADVMSKSEYEALKDLNKQLDIDNFNANMNLDIVQQELEKAKIELEALKIANEKMYAAIEATKAEVAREIFEEIDDLRRYIILNEDIALKCKQENGEKNEEYWKGKLSAFKQIRAYIDAELKKKYTEGASE